MANHSLAQHTTMLDATSIRCPWCGERFEILVDGSAGDADYTEDCAVCCRPIAIHVDVDADGELSGIDLDRE